MNARRCSTVVVRRDKMGQMNIRYGRFSGRPIFFTRKSTSCRVFVLVPVVATQPMAALNEAGSLAQIAHPGGTLYVYESSRHLAVKKGTRRTSVTPDH